MFIYIIYIPTPIYFKHNLLLFLPRILILLLQKIFNNTIKCLKSHKVKKLPNDNLKEVIIWGKEKTNERNL